MENSFRLWVPLMGTTHGSVGNAVGELRLAPLADEEASSALPLAVCVCVYKLRVVNSCKL